MFVCVKKKNNNNNFWSSVVSASVSETSVSSSTPASAIIYDACTSIIKEKRNLTFGLPRERQTSTIFRKFIKLHEYPDYVLFQKIQI